VILPFVLRQNESVSYRPRVQERLGHSTIVDIYGHPFPRHDDSEELAAAERAPAYRLNV
jgi:hypothetical protein